MAHSTSLGFLPKLLLQHDASPDTVLEDVASAFVAAAQQRRVHASVRPGGDGLAVALGQRLVVLHGLGLAASTGSSGEATASGGRSRRGSGAAAAAPAIEFVSAVDAPETITALCWLAGSGQSADECLLVGTSSGHLQLHSATSGALLLRQQLHHTAAVAAAVRWGGSGTDPEDLSEDVTVTFADAVVRLPAWEVWAAVRWHAGQAGRSGGSHWWSAASAAATAAAGSGTPHHLAFSKFMLPRGTGPRSAALCLGPPPPSLYAAMMGRREGQHRLHIVTVGSAPPVAAYEAEESRAPGLLSLVSDLASSTAASLLGKARSYVPNPAAAAGRSLLGGLRRQRSGGGSGGSVASSASSSMADLQAAGAAGQQHGRRRADKIPGEPASLAAAVWDEKRAVTQMAPSPCGRWAACCDSLGRVLLVDTTSTLILRMLKGYRNAQVAWLVFHEGCSTAGSAGGGQGGWAARCLHAGGSSSSLGGSSVAGSLSVRSSAADLAGLQPQVEWEEGWGMEDAAEQQSDERDTDPGELAEQQQQQQHAAGGSPEWQPPPSAQHSPAQQKGAAAEAPRPAALPRSPLLVIYAPRRAVVELWEPHSLSRLGSVACSTQLGLLLAQPVRRQHGGASAPGTGVPPPNRCMLLDACTLTLTDLTDVLLSSAL